MKIDVALEVNRPGEILARWNYDLPAARGVAGRNRAGKGGGAVGDTISTGPKIGDGKFAVRELRRNNACENPRDRLPA